MAACGYGSSNSEGGDDIDGVEGAGLRLSLEERQKSHCGGQGWRCQKPRSDTVRAAKKALGIASTISIAVIRDVLYMGGIYRGGGIDA